MAKQAELVEIIIGHLNNITELNREILERSYQISSQESNKKELDKMYKNYQKLAEALCDQNGLLDYLNDQLKPYNVKPHVNPYMVRVLLESSNIITQDNYFDALATCEFWQAALEEVSQNASLDIKTKIKQQNEINEMLNMSIENYEIASSKIDPNDTVLVDTHLMKSRISADSKSQRNGKITDMIRLTLLAQNPFNEQELPFFIQKVAEIFCTYDLKIEDKIHNFRLIDLEAKITDTGYSDVTMKFEVIINGEAFYFETQINTQEFFDTKSEETKFYDIRKASILRMNTILNLYLKPLILERSKIKIPELNSFIAKLQKLGLINEEGILEENKPNALKLIRKFIKSKIPPSKKVSKEEIDETLDSKIKQDFYNIFLEYLEAYLISCKLYEPLQGVIKNKPTANKIIQKANHLCENFRQVPAVKITRAGDRQSNKGKRFIPHSKQRIAA